jgi:hypothetical protein
MLINTQDTMIKSAIQIFSQRPALQDLNMPVKLTDDLSHVPSIVHLQAKYQILSLPGSQMQDGVWQVVFVADT